DFDAAVADCPMVVGTSARTGGLFRRQSVGPPEEVLPRLLPALESGPAALVFGPEPSGLSDAEVTRCHYLVHIPTAPDHPALALRQGVATCLYELRPSCLAEPSPGVATRGSPATFAAQEQMFAQLRTALEEIHFLYGPNADSLMHALRHLLGRAQLTDMEVNVLRGLAPPIRFYLAPHPP